MRVAYLINQYPKVSHSFIRREIIALEKQGVEIFRISIRRTAEKLVDDLDRAEDQQTFYVLENGYLLLLTATVLTAISRPLAFIRAFKLACSMARGSDRPLFVHLIYLVESCRILVWLRSKDVHHLHAHFGSNSAEVAMLVHTLGGPRWSFTVHGPEEFDKAPVIGLAEKLRSCAFVVAISSFGRSQLYRLIKPAHWGKVHVIRCGVDDEFLTVESSAPVSRNIVCVGRLCEQKGQHLLIDAVKRLVDEGLDFHLTLAGDGELRGETEELITRLGLQERVTITGWISGIQVREEILKARALVLPSFAEGLPVVLMEAMALGRTVISTYIAGIPELVVNEANGWLVPAGDIEALCGALRACLASSVDNLRKRGEAGRQRVVDWHDINKEAAKLRALFSQP